MKYLVFMAVMAILCYKEKKVCGFVGRWKEQHRSCQEDAGLSPQVMFHIGYTLGLLPLIDLIPWVLNLRVSTMITKLFSFLHKQSPWKKIIVCFEYLLVASVLLAISPLVRSELQGNQKPIVLVDSDSDNNGRVTQSNRDPVRCDLRLMLVDTADSLVNKGRNLVIVALVGNNLHIRIFDANGKKIVDKAENELIGGKTLAALKKQLDPLPNESGLSSEQKQKIIQEAISIADNTLSVGNKKKNNCIGKKEITKRSEKQYKLDEPTTDELKRESPPDQYLQGIPTIEELKKALKSPPDLRTRSLHLPGDPSTDAPPPKKDTTLPKESQ